MRSVIILFLLFMIVDLSAVNLNNLKYGPIPYYPNLQKNNYNGKFTVYGDMDSNAQILYYIFTFTGNLIYKGKASKLSGAGNQILFDWDGKNQDGRYVCDGGYIIQIKAKASSGDIIKFIKVLVIKDK